MYAHTQANPSPTLQTLYFSSGSGTESPRPPSPRLNLIRYRPPYNIIDGLPMDDAPTGTPDAAFDFGAVDCIDALIEEDWERLRARRCRATRANPSSDSPIGSGEAEEESTPLQEDYLPSRSGLGTGSTIREVLPFRSRFYEWSKEYFVEPQMRVSVPPIFQMTSIQVRTAS